MKHNRKIFERNFRSLITFLVSKSKVENFGLPSQCHKVMPIAYLMLDVSSPLSYRNSQPKIAVELLCDKIDSFGITTLQVEENLFAANRDFVFQQFIKSGK